MGSLARSQSLGRHFRDQHELVLTPRTPSGGCWPRWQSRRGIHGGARQPRSRNGIAALFLDESRGARCFWLLNLHAFDPLAQLIVVGVAHAIGQDLAVIEDEHPRNRRNTVMPGKLGVLVDIDAHDLGQSTQRIA